jgi:hypothetical protein
MDRGFGRTPPSLIFKATRARGSFKSALGRHAQPLTLEFAATPSSLQRPRRQPGIPIIVCVKAREMLTYDFVRFITLEAPGAGVPARDYAIRVNDVDGIVRYGLNQ